MTTGEKETIVLNILQSKREKQTTNHPQRLGNFLQKTYHTLTKHSWVVVSFDVQKNNNCGSMTLRRRSCIQA